MTTKLVENYMAAATKAVPSMDNRQSKNLKLMLENVEQAYALHESTDAGATNGTKLFAMDLISTVIPNLVVDKLVSIQPMDNMVGVVNYIKYIYGSNKGTVKAGDTFASALQNNNTNMYYSSEEVRDEAVINAAGKELKTNLSWLPVVPGSVVFKGTATVGGVKKAIEITDNKTGGFLVVDAATQVPLNLPATGSVDYASGAVDVTVAGMDDVPADGTTVTYHYNQSSVGAGKIGDNTLQTPEVNIEVATIPIIAKTRKLKALYAFDAAFNLNKQYGSDINALLNTQTAAEIAHEIDGEIMNDLLAGAGIENDSWSRKQPVGVSKLDHYDSFLPTLVQGSNQIFQFTKRASGNFVIAGMDVASVIESCRQFRPANLTAGVVGPHIMGTLGQFTVVKNPYYPTTSYTIGYKGTNLFDAGYVFSPYMPVISTNLVMMDDFVGRTGWATSYGKQMLNNKLYVRGEITLD
jgi:hypothetical protein